MDHHPTGKGASAANVTVSHPDTELTPDTLVLIWDTIFPKADTQCGVLSSGKNQPFDMYTERLPSSNMVSRRVPSDNMW